MLNSMVMSIFLFWIRNALFGMANLVLKIKIVCLNINLVPRLELKYAEFSGNFHFSLVDWKYLFWANLVQKIKFFCLN